MVKKDIYLIIGLLILVVVSPLIITQPSLIDSLNFSEKGQIGDTIGGITAPIVNLIGAFLVYISFREQLRANTIQNRNFTTEQERNNKERRYNSLINDIDNLRVEIREFTYTKKTASFVGPRAIKAFSDDFLLQNDIQSVEKFTTETSFLDFYFLIASSDNVQQIVDSADLEDFDKIILFRKLIFLYTSKIIPVFIPMLVHHQKLLANGIEIAQFEPLIMAYDKLNALTIKYGI